MFYFPVISVVDGRTSLAYHRHRSIRLYITGNILHMFGIHNIKNTKRYWQLLDNLKISKICNLARIDDRPTLISFSSLVRLICVVSFLLGDYIHLE